MCLIPRLLPIAGPRRNTKKQSNECRPQLKIHHTTTYCCTCSPELCVRKIMSYWENYRISRGAATYTPLPPNILGGWHPLFSFFTCSFSLSLSSVRCSCLIREEKRHNCFQKVRVANIRRYYRFRLQLQFKILCVAMQNVY